MLRQNSCSGQCLRQRKRSPIYNQQKNVLVERTSTGPDIDRFSIDSEPQKIQNAFDPQINSTQICDYSLRTIHSQLSEIEGPDSITYPTELNGLPTQGTTRLFGLEQQPSLLRHDKNGGQSVQ